jgi:hypothetical protein
VTDTINVCPLTVRRGDAAGGPQSLRRKQSILYCVSIDAEQDQVIGTINVGTPSDVSVTPDGRKVYVVSTIPNYSVSVMTW